MQKLIWVIDDEQAICWALKRALEKAGHRATTFSNAEDALSALNATPHVDAIMMDMRMPGIDGFEATRQFKKIRPQVPIVMMTAFGDLASAIQAMDLDIFEYLTKPFDLSDGLRAIEKALASKSPVASAMQVSDSLQDDALIGSSKSIQSVYKQIAIAAKSDVSVLIQGPSGSGKESVASAIHRYSNRKDSPFFVFTPNSVSPIAVSMELLGSTQVLGGASGGANAIASKYDRPGAIERSGNGVLYIHEVGDLPMSLQSQLLRVLEQRTFVPLGGSEGKACNARIIVSTSRNLASLVADGELLDALRHRLGVFVIELSPLAERREDIMSIANSILNQENPKLHFSEEASAWLVSRPWVGNIREMRSAIQHAVLVTRGHCVEVDSLSRFAAPSQEIQKLDGIDFADAIRSWTLKHLDELEKVGQRIHNAPSEDSFGAMYEDFLATIEPPFLEAMMAAFHGNRAAIAAQLGLHRSTLRQKMRRYKID